MQVWLFWVVRNESKIKTPLSPHHHFFPGSTLYHCVGVLHGLQCGYLLWHGPLHGLKGSSFKSYHGITLGCRQISAPAPEAPPPTPSFLTFTFSGLFHTLFSSFFSLLYSILHFLKYIFPVEPPVWLMSLAVSLDRSIAKLSGTVCVWHSTPSSLFS